MVGPTSVEFLTLRGCQLELALTFGLREAFPQSHRELGAFAWTTIEARLGSAHVELSAEGLH